MVHDKATSVGEGKVSLESGDVLDYDVLVIATGSKPAFLGREPPTDVRFSIFKYFLNVK